MPLPRFAGLSRSPCHERKALLEIVPTEEELHQVASYELSPGEKLGEAERFFLEVSGVTRLEQRLFILRMRHSFSAAMKVMGPTLSRPTAPQHPT